MAEGGLGVRTLGGGRRHAGASGPVVDDEEPGEEGTLFLRSEVRLVPGSGYGVRPSRTRVTHPASRPQTTETGRPDGPATKEHVDATGGLTVSGESGWGWDPRHRHRS